MSSWILGDATWQGPGDMLYATPSNCANSLVTIKQDHYDSCACLGCRTADDEIDPCPIEGDHDHWAGGGDAMRWTPGFTHVYCGICNQDHGAECPKRHMVMLSRINFAGSEDYIRREPGVPALARQPHEHREGAA